MILVIDQILSMFRTKGKESKSDIEIETEFKKKKNTTSKVPVVVPVNATVNNPDLNSNVVDKNPNLKAQAWTDTINDSSTKNLLSKAPKASTLFSPLNRIFKGNVKKGKTRGVIK